jgi:rhodanese-related sulfurtransferase
MRAAHGRILTDIVIPASRSRARLDAHCGQQEADMPNNVNPSHVAEVPAADSPTALAHFEALLGFETDCWDVHESLESGEPGFVLLDVRSPERFREGHVPDAVSLPYRRLTERNLAVYPSHTLFVVYCDGPHCNGADKAAIRLARLGRPVKKMIGGIIGWKDEGFSVNGE